MTDKTPSREQCVEWLERQRRYASVEDSSRIMAICDALLALLRPAPQPSIQPGEQTGNGLLQCPFCGKAPSYRFHCESTDVGWSEGLGSPGKMYYDYHDIQCRCGAVVSASSKETAISAWNTRAQLAPTAPTATPSKGPEGQDNEPGVLTIESRLGHRATMNAKLGMISFEYQGEFHATGPGLLFKLLQENAE